TCPTEGSTWYLLPRKFLNVLVLVGDSTIMSDFAISHTLGCGGIERSLRRNVRYLTFALAWFVKAVIRRQGVVKFHTFGFHQAGGHLSVALHCREWSYTSLGTRVRCCVGN